MGGEYKTYRIWNLGFVCLGRRGTDDNLYNFFVCLAGVLVFYHCFNTEVRMTSFLIIQRLWSSLDRKETISDIFIVL